jgi:hypothetical protein
MINQSTSISELATALSKAQAQMGSAIKDSENPFFKSKYADLTSVIAAVRKPFADNGLSFVQLPVSEAGCVGVATRIMHSSGEWLESEFLIPCKQDAHGYAAGITYCRRLSLQAAAGVPTDDDDGNSAIIDYQKDYSSSIDAIITGIAESDLSSAAEEWFTLPKHVQEALWVAPSKGGSFSTKNREVMKSSEFRAAYYGEGA